MTKISKNKKAVAKAIAKHIHRQGNSLDKQSMIEVVADVFASADPQFDRNSFCTLSYYHCPITPMISVAAVVNVIRLVRKLHPDASLDAVVAALALLSANAGFDKDVFIEFADK